VRVRAAGIEIVESPPRPRKAMTVCIGAICEEKRNPGAIMLGVDLRITYTSQGGTIHGKHDLSSKVFSLPYGFSAVVAGTMPRCQTLISFLYDYMENLAPVSENLQLDHISFCAKRASEQVTLSIFERALVNNLGMTRLEWVERQSNIPLREDGRNLLAKINPDANCLIAGFIRSRPVLIRVMGKQVPEEITSHSAIGIGAKYALQKLAKRRQGPYCSMQRTALALSEGLRYARKMSGGFVGPPAHCLILRPEMAAVQFNPQADLLRRWSRATKAKDTDSLDSEEYRGEFSKILVEVPQLTKQSASRT
jgi:hypothetical protein